jgi:MSHA biogenesis protein MshO
MNARQNGFTLIELIVALTISVVVVGFVASFIAVPVQAHLAQARRSELAASAEAVTLWMSRDIRRALPNSVRVATVGGRPAVEMISFEGVSIYRDDTLTDGTADTAFDVVALPPVSTQFVVINNTGIGVQSAYAAAAVTRVRADAQVNVASMTIGLNPAFNFIAQSPRLRVFLVPGTPVIRYECDLVARTLRRYEGLGITAAMAVLPAGTPFTVVARDVTACTFTAPPAPVANQNHGGLMPIRVTISRVTNGATDSLRIMKQLKVEEEA